MKFLTAIVLVLVLVFGPTPVYSEGHCVPTEIVELCPIKPTSEPTVIVPDPAPTPAIPNAPDVPDVPDVPDLPDVELPDVEVPDPTRASPQRPRNQSEGSGESARGNPQPRVLTPILPGFPGHRNTVPYIEPPVASSEPPPNEEIIHPDDAPDLEIFGQPWYLWLTILIAVGGIALMLFLTRKTYKPRHRRE